MDERAREFTLVVERCAEALRFEAGYDPSRWTRMVHYHGAVNAARLWLSPEFDASVELNTLAEDDRLDQSVEWFALVYFDLFAPQQRQEAHRRLRSHGSPVDQWLSKRLSRKYA